MLYTIRQEMSLGKPLITDAAMSGMYRTMQHIVAERHSTGFAADLPKAVRSALQQEPEAVLAALFSQVHRRDTVLAEGPNPLVQTAADTWFPHTGAPTLHAVQGSAEECAGIAAGMALRVADKAATQPGDVHAADRPRPVIIALLRGFSPLISVLQLVQQYDLALLLVVSGEPESRADAQRRMLSTTVPIMPVDRADAVAVCRVMQECLLRARSGWGGAVIHAAPLPGSQDALTLMSQHLEKRGLVSHAGPDPVAGG